MPLLTRLFQRAAAFLCLQDAPQQCDLILVLAGRPERKAFGLELYRQQLAPELVVSVSRSEVRYAAQELSLPELLQVRDATPPKQRHFWIRLSEKPASIERAFIKRSSTFWELQAFAKLLHNQLPPTVAIVSTSIHLRRVRYCCGRIAALSKTNVLFLAVPDEMSSFVLARWWKRRGHWPYLLREYIKLAGYKLLY